MARTYKTVEGLTYADLDAALLHLGYVRREEADRVVYTYPADSDAKLLLTRRPLTEEVRGVVVRATVDSFGILDAKDFDLLLLSRTGVSIPALTH
jgi:hypothetical protein